MFEFLVILLLLSMAAIAALLVIMLIFATKGGPVKSFAVATAGCIVLCVALFFGAEHFYARPADKSIAMDSGFPALQGSVPAMLPAETVTNEPERDVPMSEADKAYEWATEELNARPYLSSPWSIRQRMINQGGFSEEIADEVLEMLGSFNWGERAFVGAEELATSGQIGRSGLISELERELHSPETITVVMEKIDGLGIDWYEMAAKFIDFHGPTSGYMNHENMFRDWMINDIGFTESEAQHAYDGFWASGYEPECYETNEDMPDADETPPGATFWWVDTGGVYHNRRRCPAIVNVTDINSGAEPPSGRRLCLRC